MGTTSLDPMTIVRGRDWRWEMWVGFWIYSDLKILKVEST